MPSLNQEKGYHRDREILLITERLQAVSAEQIKVLLFSNQKHGLRKSQERLQKLYSRGKIKRWRGSPNESYIYFTERKNGKHGRMEHLILLNWVYVWLRKTIKNWEEVWRWDLEQDYGILQCDAFVGIKNKITEKTRFMFVELDRAESGNEFDKIRKYCKLYEGNMYEKWWWVEMVDRFPNILLVTTLPARVIEINKIVKKENKELEFKVHLLENIKGECLV